ncbi:ATP-dependent DNA helicase DinG [Ectopseudomonas chengduensis]|uniref:ATP-dependent DNA helicase DinG n=1 Tax=Ectopseudomonas chengduensis TaxID=489632 RepID=A0A1G6Q486_9GAMM|nr:helicase C-terminal domain-containing protein [Pseudomonas chengduensis]MBP3062042.1 hypothetical protein [Pseudomonas chengduensis]NNB75334.1 hypothetical protein [Pseudomonas chengduensis]SDC86447.1 ATP-dependent DNA helicase DinG [Pseudomonas chengduensis]
MSDLEKKLLKVVDDILGPDGKLVWSREAYHYNPKQHAYAQTVVRGFCRYREADNAAAVNLLQAATGTGKSLGYLVPAFAYSALTGERVLVSTFTRALQQQIIQNDAPKARDWIRQVTGTVVTFARRVGRQNYLSESACREYLDRLTESQESAPDAIEFVSKMLAWIEQKTQSLPTLEDYLFEVGEDGSVLPAGIERASLCLNASAPAEELESYSQGLTETFNADVLIVNHALMMLDVSRWASIIDGGERKATILICDEADRLADAAESVLSAEVSVHRLSKLTSEIADAYALPGLQQSVSSLYNAVMEIDAGESKLAVLPVEVTQRINGVLKALRPHVEHFCEMLESSQAELDAKPKAVLAEFCDSYNDLARVAKADQQDGNLSIISWSPVRHYPSLRVGRPEPARIITRLLAPRDWDEGEVEGVAPPRSYLRAALFTSATLATPGRTLPMAFDAFAQTIGVIRHCQAGMNYPIHNVTADLYRVFDAPEGFGHMSFVLPEPSAPLPTNVAREDDDTAMRSNPEWLDYAASMIRAAASSGGRTLVLTLSHGDSSELERRLNGLVGLIVARKGDSMGEIKQQYLRTERAVLISPNAWEGIDLPGNVQSLVITRIPFGSLSGFRLSLMEVNLRHRGFSDAGIDKIKFDSLNAQARQRFSQGLGRGIRRRDDRVRVWIADGRFPYPAEFASSLDEVLMTPRERVLKSFEHCIPARFEDNFKASRLFLKTGDLYTPELV